jgi:hypothetical protein
MAMYRGVKLSLQIMAPVIATSGALTDELVSPNIGGGPGDIGATGDAIDERVLSGQAGPLDGSSRVYTGLQRVRGGALEAIGLLKTYAPETSPALRGEMYALDGYAETLLAELFCSGVPLSTLDYKGDFTYKSGSTSKDVYVHALTLLDSAMVLAHDSESVMNFARVVKGRILLDLGRYADAAQAVTTVATNFTYTVPVFWASVSQYFQGYSVATSEGEYGLPFGTGNDPRALVTANGTNAFGVSLYMPAQYPSGSTTPVVLASGVEARLITAEAELQADSTTQAWLITLNALRTTCTMNTSCPTPAPAGTGGVTGLPPLSDPGSDTARVTLLFNERAYWLFLTGHRQGDLRRLVRNYGRSQETVYPTGVYYGGLGFYGSDVDLPIPATEQVNPYYSGCFNREA